MCVDDAAPTDAADPAGSGHANGTAEPRPPRWPSPWEQICRTYEERRRRSAAAHAHAAEADARLKTPPAPAAPDAPAAPVAPPPRTARRPRQHGPADRPGRVLRWLPAGLVRLYDRLIHPTPYARTTRVRPAPEPDPEISVSMRERMFRVEIIQDAFCERRPKPQRLFRKPSGHRDMESWCDLEVSRYPTTRHRCAHCAETRALFKRANDGEWQAEVRLHRLATRASMRLLAERRAWADTRRRQRAARTPRPGPPPVIWVMLGWKRWRDRRAEYATSAPWFIVERSAAEAKLVRAHARKLRRDLQKRQARTRERELAREPARAAAALPPAQSHPVMAGPRDWPQASPRTCLVPAIHDFADVAEESKSWMTGTSPVMTEKERADGAVPAPNDPTLSSRGAQRRDGPAPRDRRTRKGPPRRQSATRDDDARAPAPAVPEQAPPPVPQPVRYVLSYRGGSSTRVRIGGGPTIPAPANGDHGAIEPVSAVTVAHAGLGEGRHSGVAGECGAQQQDRECRTRGLAQPHVEVEQRTLPEFGDHRPMPGCGRGGADEAVEQHRNAPLPGGERSPEDRGELPPAERHRRAQRIATHAGVARERGIDHGALANKAGIVDAGAAPGPARTVAAEQRRGEAGGGGGVADPHLAQCDEIE